MGAEFTKVRGKSTRLDPDPADWIFSFPRTERCLEVNHSNQLKSNGLVNFLKCLISLASILLFRAQGLHVPVRRVSSLMGLKPAPDFRGG